MSKSILSVISMLCFLSTAYAHDTTHIHPMITKRISDLIKQEDSDSAYLELHLEHPDINNRGLFWGKDREDVMCTMSYVGCLSSLVFIAS